MSKSKKFLFGIATAAHHIEGNNFHSDWWHQEQSDSRLESSGLACDSYREFKRDRKLLVQLNCSAYRFSIEWSRIEPVEGQFDLTEVEHYVSVIDDLIAHGIEPIVTWHHFTNPAWFEASGGWTRSDAYAKFLRFVEFVLPHLRHKVRYFTPINEPNVYVLNKYLIRLWHPHEANLFVAWRVFDQLVRAHRGAYQLIKSENTNAFVGSCIHVADLRALKTIWLPFNLVSAGVGHFIFNHLYLIMIGDCFDFSGINFYSTFRMGLAGIFPWPKISPHPLEGGMLNMGSTPDRLLVMLRSLQRYGKPIMITENGMLTNDDAKRQEHLCDMFALITKARAEGIALIGYLHFTHLDSYEWSFGYKPKFGLYGYDFKTKKVVAKPSARLYADLIKKYYEQNHTLSLV